MVSSMQTYVLIMGEADEFRGQSLYPGTNFVYVP